jgi:predicted DNA-binding transcriptional regulator YafY
MMKNAILERAIRQNKVISFFYQCEDAPRFQIVEPHEVEAGANGEPILRAWLLDGWSAKGKGWREYPVSKVDEVSVLPNRFAPRETDREPAGAGMFVSH